MYTLQFQYLPFISCVLTIYLFFYLLFIQIILFLIVNKNNYIIRKFKNLKYNILKLLQYHLSNDHDH